MSNIRGTVTCLEALYNLVTAYTANSFQTYCKGTFVNRLDFFASLPDGVTPCVIFNDGGEEFVSAGKVGNEASVEEIKIRVHKIDVYCIEHYIDQNALLIGDAASVGIIDFSHLVELALLSSKKLESLYKFMAFEPWIPVDITNPENPNIVIACGRKAVIAYTTVPEVI